MSKSDALIRGLQRLGYVEHPCRSAKYREFRRGERRYLVGGCGALRTVDIDAPISSSISVSHTINAKGIIALGELGGADELTPAAASAWLRNWRDSVATGRTR